MSLFTVGWHLDWGQLYADPVDTGTLSRRLAPVLLSVTRRLLQLGSRESPYFLHEATERRVLRGLNELRNQPGCAWVAALPFGLSNVQNKEKALPVPAYGRMHAYVSWSYEKQKNVAYYLSAKKRVKDLHDALVKRGFQVVLYEDESQKDDWSQAIDSSQVVIVCLTRAYAEATKQQATRRALPPCARQTPHFARRHT